MLGYMHEHIVLITHKSVRCEGVMYQAVALPAVSEAFGSVPTFARLEFFSRCLIDLNLT